MNITRSRAQSIESFGGKQKRRASKLFQTKAEEVERSQSLGKVRKELQEFVASLPKLHDSAPLIRQDRQR